MRFFVNRSLKEKLFGSFFGASRLTDESQSDLGKGRCTDAVVTLLRNSDALF